MFNENMDKASKYHLHCLQTYTNYHTDSDNTDTSTINPGMEFHDMVMIGDKVCGKFPLKTGNACLAVAKISIREIESRKFLTVSAMVKMGDPKFQVTVFNAHIHGEKLKFRDTTSGLVNG